MAERWLIVGAGSAGCVVASRLSEDPQKEVTLVDDGPHLLPGAVPPGISGRNFVAALAEPGRTHEDLLARRTSAKEPTAYLRGRGVGGSSAVNAMVALRGSDELYRSWGWLDAEAMWARVAIPAEPAASHEIGVVDRALLAADSRTELVQLTRALGQRVTSAEAYLWPALGRPNLSVEADHAVDRVLFDGRRATGVRFADGSERAADHIILSAGAIHTPTILLRSGVVTAGIGEGLQDHPSGVFTLKLRDDVAQDLSGLAIASLLHAAVGDATVQLLPMNNLGPDPALAGLAILMVALMTPHGHAGTVGIDAEGSAVVDFALLDDPRDLQALVAGIHLALETLHRPAFAEIVEDVFIDDVGTRMSSLGDDDAIAGWLRDHCGDYVHASSTCAMGRVVDQRGAVFGYERLSVCDASIFPSIPDANTHLPTTMAAERLCQIGFS